MKTKFLIIGILLLNSVGLFAQKGVVNKGAKIIITSNAYLNIDGGTDADYTNKSFDIVNHGKIDLQGKIKLQGDWQNQATSGNVFINTATDGEVVFDGTTQQTIGGTASTNFEKFTLNNPVGVRLNTTTAIKGTLTLTSGLIKIGTNNLFLDAATTILGTPSSTAMIVANNTGNVYKYLNTVGTFTFPVGDTLGTTEYSPFTVAFNSGTFGSGAYVKLNVTNSKHPNNSSTSAYLNRYWTVNTSDITSINADVTAKYTDADIFGTEGNIYMSKYDSPYWDKYNVANTASNLLTANITSFSDFTGAESVAISPAITLSGSMTEGSENGQVITVSLSNDDFVASLNTANWAVTNLPQGVTKGTITRTGDKTVTIALSGNRITDFDSDITDVTVTISAGELFHNTALPLSASSGVTITATNDSESITMTDDGLITEGSENGELITVTAVGGTFVTPINQSDWALTRMPAGVSKGTVTWVDPTTVQIALSGNSSLDYDSDSLNTTLTINQAAIDEYTGSDLSVNTGVKFTAIDESLTISMASDGSILEGAEDSELITVTISGKIFAATLNPANWILTNLPQGVTEGTINRIGDTQATIALVGTRNKDYDTDISNLTVQIASGEIDLYTPVAYITSGVTFTADNDSETITLTDNGISEGAETGKKIIVTLSGGTFASSLTLANWTVTNLPTGVIVGSINRVDSIVAELILSGNSIIDFDTNITNVTVSAAPGEIDDHTGSSISANSGVTIVATNDVEVLYIADDGSLTEGSENSEVITVTLTGGTIVDPINSANWYLSNLPTGVTASPAVRLSSTSVYFTLMGNATQDYDANITNTTLTVASSEISDTTGTYMVKNTGVTFIATDEPVVLTLTDNVISEGLESGEVITVALEQDTFVAGLTDANWHITNLPQGVFKGTINRVSDDTVTITLTGNRTQDYDTNITNVTVTIDGAELTQHTAAPVMQNNGLVFYATDDIELLTMNDDGQIMEGAESGEVITVTLSGGTFSSPLTPSNWALTGLPIGVSIGSVLLIDNTTVEITLSGNSTMDYDTDITSCSLSVNEAEVDDYSDVNLTATSGVAFTAVIETIDITMADDGTLYESNEDNEIITVNISNDVFASSLNNANWILSNIPVGVAIGSVTRINDTVAEITLSGNRTKDYDTDISTTSLSIAKEEFANQNSTVIVNSGVLFQSLNDDESITISDNGDINEGFENGKTILVTLSGGTFSETLNNSNWIVSNLPAGVSIGSIFKIDTNKVQITLSGNSTIDYDASIVNFTLSVNESEFDDYNGANIIVSNGVVFNALVEDLAISASGLSESNINGAVVAIELTNDSFLDASFDFNNFILNNAPLGVTINYIEYLDAYHANLYLLFDGTDFDTDVTDFSVTILENEIQGVANLSSNQIPIASVVENIAVTMYDEGIFEGQEDGAVIYVIVKQDQFAATLEPSNWVLSNLPNGVTIGSITRQSNDTVIVTLTGNRINDYDANIYNIQLDVAANEFENSISPVSVTSGIVMNAYNDSEYITLSDNGINEGLENGKIIYVKLNGGTFTSSINPAYWVLTNIPNGVSIGSVALFGTDSAQITLSGNATIDYDYDITNATLSINELEIDDYTGNDITASSGAVFIANNDDEILTMTDNGSLTEGEEDGKTIEVTLAGGTFAPLLDLSQWVSNNLPVGVTIGSIDRINSQRVVLTLTGNRTVDYDTNITNYTLTINDNQIDDFSGSSIQLTTGVIFLAKNEVATIYHAGLTEENLNGAAINLALTNESFVDNQLSKTNFGMNGMPLGATLDSVEYVDANNAILHIAFDGTDFDSLKENIYLIIDKSELAGNTYLFSDSISIAATDDAEVLTMSDDGFISEGMENGEQINITLTGGTFANPLLISSWSLFNAPLGVTIGSLNRISSTSATLVLNGNSLQDYDADITDFTIQIQTGQVSDYQGGSILISSGVTFHANNEQLSITHSGLTESNLNGAVIDLNLVNESFTDVILNRSSFILNNAPVGLTVSSAIYNSATSASLVLSFDGTDFDEDFNNFNISIDELELNGVGVLTSNNLTISAITELQTAIISHLGLTEENLNGAIVKFELKHEFFNDAVLDKSNFNLLGAPTGTSISDVVYSNDSVAMISIIFSGIDFDSDFSNFKISVNKVELAGSSGITSDAINIAATDDIETISMESDGYIVEGSEDGEIITVSISGGTFANNLFFDMWSALNLPFGVTIGSLNRIDNHTVAITLAGNSIYDYDQDITNFELQVNESEIDDYSGVPLFVNTGVLFTAIVEPEAKVLTISGGGLFENSLNGASLSANLTADYLNDNIVNVQNLELINAPLGLSINSVTVIDSVSFLIEFAFDGSDYDADISDLKITLLGSELQSGLNITSNDLYLYAIIESQNIFVSDPGLTELNLNNSTIQLAIDGDTFIDNVLDVANFKLSNAPYTSSVINVAYINDTAATVTISFDGTDFDNDIANFGVVVLGSEFSNGQSIRSNDITITAINDEEIFTLSYDGQITEGSENGELITLTLTGGTFVENPSFGAWIIDGLPQGVSVGTIEKVSSQQINFILQGNSVVDYDTNLTQFSVLVGASDFNDYNGSNVLVKGGVIFTANLENPGITIAHSGLNEMNLNGATIELSLTDAFFDITQNGNIAEITLNNAPSGLSVSDFQIVDNKTANLTISYLGSDFDLDYTNFNITLNPIMFAPQILLTSNNLVILASIEPLVLVSYDGQITEGAENGELISITLSEGSFVGSFSINDLSVGTLPTGVSVGNLQHISDNVCTFQLTGNRTTDYDTDINSSICEFNKTVFQNYYGNNVSVNANIIFSALNESLTILHSGLNEGNLNGASIQLQLTDDFFVDESISPSNITLFNVPQGVSINQINYVNNTQAELILAFDGTDFANNFPDFYVEINQFELVGVESLQSNKLLISEGVGIINDQSSLGLSIYSNQSSVFVGINNLPKSWESASINIYDTKGNRIYFSNLEYSKINKIDLNVFSGNYLVLVNVNGMEFVNKVFVLQE